MKTIIETIALLGLPLGAAMLTIGMYGVIFSHLWYWHAVKLTGVWTVTAGMLCVGAFGILHTDGMMDAGMAGMSLSGGIVMLACSGMETIRQAMQWKYWTLEKDCRRKSALARQKEAERDASDTRWASGR